MSHTPHNAQTGQARAASTQANASASPRVREVLSTQSIAFKRPVGPNEPAIAHPQSPQATPSPHQHTNARQQEHQHATGNGYGQNHTYSNSGTAQAQAQAKPKSYAEENPEYANIELLSGFQPYSFKSLAVRAVKGKHQAKFHRAKKENRIRFLVEAISAVLEPSVSAFQLVPADFYFLMYWLRLQSFTKVPMIITTSCDNQAHVKEVIAGTKPKESLRIEEWLNRTTLESSHLAKLDWAEVTKGLEHYPMGFETMQDVVEVSEFLMDADIDDPEVDTDSWMWSATRASFLDKSLTLAQRIAIVEDMTVDETELLEKYMEVVTAYGVDESANVKCKECGASTSVKISFDALTFLPGG